MCSSRLFRSSRNSGGTFRIGPERDLQEGKTLRVSRACFLVALLSLSVLAWADVSPVVRFRRTIVVSPVPDHPSASGLALLSALASIKGASQSDPWLLKLEPGVYDVGANPVIMKPYVDIEGSGEGVTRITGAGAADSSTGAIVGASNTELRLITVENRGQNDYSTAIFLNSVSMKLVHVTAKATGSTQTTFAGNFGIVLQSGSSVEMKDVTVSAEGEAANFAVSNNDASSLRMSASRLSAKRQDIVFGPPNVAFLNASSEAALDSVALTATSGGLPSAGVQNLNAASLSLRDCRSDLIVNVVSTAEARNSTIVEISNIGESIFKLGASQLGVSSGSGLACVVSFGLAFQPLGPDCRPLP
jgi:hypothetical protein